MALPDALQNAALRLPSAAARLAGVPGSGLPLNAEEAEQVALMLVAVKYAFGDDRDAHGSSVVDSILADDPLRLALLRLVAFAVRCGQQRGPFSGVAERALTASTSLLRLANPTAWRTRTQLDFARKLLRMHTLQSCSRAFSAAVAAVEAAEVPAGPGGGGAGAALAAAGPQAQPTISIRLLNESCSMVNSMLLLSFWAVNGAGSGFTARQLQQFNEQQQLYARELAAALRDSCVLEHAARWALHVQLAEAGGRVLDGPISDPLSFIVLDLEHANRFASRLDDGVAAPALREVLSGPCVRHLALSMGLAALCAADGGPSHGLPPELLLRLPILGSGGEDLRGAHGLQQLETWVFADMMRALGDSTSAAATPPHDWRAVVGLLRRIGSLVLASARAWADEEAVGEAEAGVEALGDAEPPLQLVLPAADTMGVAELALHHLQRLLRDQDPIAVAAAPAALAEAETAWWRLAVGVATHCALWASAGERSTLAELLRCPLWSLQTDAWLLPVAPPRALAAALAGGLLPLWERLLRCAGRDPDCAEATLLTCMLGQEANHWGFWDLLAYGDPRQGAALVVTWGKLLRTLAVPQLMWSVGVEASSPHKQHTALACGLVICTCRMLRLAIDRLAASAGWGAAEASAPQQQLTRLLSCAACDWLPPFARLVREGLPAVQRAVLTGQPIPDSVQHIQAGAYDMPAWMRVLARRSGSGLAQAAEAAAESASATAPTATAATAGWRQLLLQEVGAVALLGAMCHHSGWSMHAMKSAARSCEKMAVGLLALLNSCCCVAAACPAEVRQAVLAAAAEAAAAGASSGAGQGGGGRQRGGRGTSGRGGRGGPSRAPVVPLPGWSPQLLRVLATECSGSCQGGGRMVQVAAASSALARQAEQWVAGAGEDGAELAAAVAALSPEPDVDAAARALVPSPAEARALLRTCANHACDNLAGDSEADLPLRACGRCGGAWYCRQECQAAHWRSGHREACGGRSVAVAGAVRVGQPASEASAP